MGIESTPDRVQEHVAAFNAAVGSGDWETFADRFAPDATTEFMGVPAGPFLGRAEIARAYAEQPPTAAGGLRRLIRRQTRTPNSSIRALIASIHSGGVPPPGRCTPASLRQRASPRDARMCQAMTRSSATSEPDCAR